MVFGKKMMVWIEPEEFHVVIGLCSLFCPGLTVLRKLARRLVHLARLEGEAGVG